MQGSEGPKGQRGENATGRGGQGPPGDKGAVGEQGEKGSKVSCDWSSNCDTMSCTIMGDSRKYPFPTTGGMNILNPVCLRKFQNVLPPMPFHPSGISDNFFRPFGILA